MQCSCGAMTTERTVQRDLEIVMEYQHCPKCGRVLITKDVRTEEQKTAMAGLSNTPQKTRFV